MLDALDPVLTPPKRLAIMGMLGAVSQIEFAFVRDTLELSDSDLSKQMKAIVDAGYATVRKTGKGADRQTWYSPTKPGKTALDRHFEALSALANAPAIGDAAAVEASGAG
ncbi:MAG: transcriptional regulator [Acidimicrobiales bacterium]